MTVSVRMNPLLENELEQAAKRQGVSKSQFVIDAVERALGRKEPGALLLQVRQEFAEYRVDSQAKADVPVTNNESLGESIDRPYKQKIKELLQAKHDARLADWQVFQDEQAAAQKVGKKGAGS